MMAGPQARLTSPWRGEVGPRSGPGGGESARSALHLSSKKFTPPRLAPVVLADPPPPGEGKDALWSDA